jgi:hypothetical protein
VIVILITPISIFSCLFYRVTARGFYEVACSPSDNLAI